MHTIPSHAPSLHLRRPIAAATLLLCVAAGCSGSGGASGTATAGPRVVGSAFYLDANDDGTMNAGDMIAVRFDRPVQVVRADAEQFELSVAGDRLGAGARVASGARGDEVRIVLGSQPVLRVPGTYTGDQTAGAPSGIGLAADAGIVDGNGRTAVAGEMVDVAVGLVSVREPLAVAQPASAAAAGDLDGDGDVDLVFGFPGAPTQIWWNDGRGGFQPGQTLTAGSTVALVLGDLDRDGDLDLIQGNDRDESDRVFRNDAGVLVQWQILPGSRTSALVLGDLDRDGDLDLVQGNGSGQPDRVFLNDGGGILQPGQGIGHGNTHAVALADLDGDGDLDLVQGASGPNRIWHNDGSGVFTDSGQAVGTGTTRSIAAGDLDCDGDLDLVVAGRDPARIWRNDGNGGFTPGSRLVNAATDQVLLVDLDGDGRPEVLAANANGQPDQVWWVDADLELRDSGLRLGETTTTAAVVADLDRDGDPDLVTVGPDAPVRIWSGSRSGTLGAVVFVETATMLGEGAALGLAAADVDRDGDLDLVETNAAGRGLAVWLGDGRGGFPARQLLAPGGAVVRFADVDRDGDADLLECSATIGLRLWRNEAGGPGGPTPITTAPVMTFAVGDLDRDGDQDLVVVPPAGAAPRVWRNDGTGAFTEAAPLLNGDAVAVLLLDVDGDGDLDAWLATPAGGAMLLRNDGAGTLTVAATVGSSQVTVLAAADVDRDGDLDLALGGPGGHEIWRNDAGQFAVVLHAAPGAVAAMAFGDLDRDGDADLVRADPVGPDRVWWNDGRGGFATADLTLFDGVTNDLLLADLDCDGDLDLVVADGSPGGGLRVWRQE